MSTTQGSWSYNALSASAAYVGDQGAALEVSIAATVGVVQLAPTGTDGKGEREEHWRVWIVGGTATDTFLATFRATATPASVPDLTAATAYPPKTPLVFQRANEIIGLRVPRDKPYLHFRWTGGAATLRLQRVLPQTTYPAP